MIKNFIIYHPVTGTILRTGSCPSGLVSAQRNSTSEKVIIGRANDLLERINPQTFEIKKIKES